MSFTVYVAGQHSKVYWPKKCRTREIASIVSTRDLVNPPSDVANRRKAHFGLPQRITAMLRATASAGQTD
jgi:hypothetical protein